MKYVGRTALYCAIFGMSLALISCGQNPYSDAADLPTPTAQLTSVTNQYPAVVMIILPGDVGMCSGTFISPNTVLTAAHCTLNQGQYMVQASFGTFTTSTTVKFGPGVVNDPNDIALLIFDSNVADPNQGQVYNIGAEVAVGDTLTLVGFGCDNIDTENGAGVKRTGTNQVASIDSYIDFLTPASSSTGYGEGVQRILGPSNRAGSCFGDSGGPALNSKGLVVGATHAGGSDGTNLLSEYINLTESDNHGWLQQMNSQYNLGISGL